jgi:hypothetical protein
MYQKIVLEECEEGGKRVHNVIGKPASQYVLREH